MICCKPTESPIECHHKLQTGVGESVDKERYQKLVGKLIYLSHTRLDIAYLVSLYLKSAPGKGMFFSKYGDIRIEAHTDVDWARSLDDRRSTSDNCTLIGGNLVIWSSKKKSVVARSSAKAE
uniref:Uncharacterized mitochondrial protein AtMg00810-like n=1 Tax=Nicotiana tabacum TaxID=4097 RepID=A0A1S4CHX4_TOBAC|nr:PREDICTED: uncharacterized mitochondrial protein AtMg00810-like [Nicotiana tabacum]XP_018622641.1 uncharacterized mitochondrial protein AtMg00810-like [Nicotiana tomentosiformis]